MLPLEGDDSKHELHEEQHPRDVEVDEPAHVLLPDALPHPWAMVIHVLDAVATEVAVVHLDPSRLSHLALCAIEC